MGSPAVRVSTPSRRASPDRDAFPLKGQEQAHTDLQPVTSYCQLGFSPRSGRPAFFTASMSGVVTESWTPLLITRIIFFLVTWPKQGSSRIARMGAELHFPAALLSSVAVLPVLVRWPGDGPAAIQMCCLVEQPQCSGSQRCANALWAPSASLWSFLARNTKALLVQNSGE